MRDISAITEKMKCHLVLFPRWLAALLLFPEPGVSLERSLSFSFNCKLYFHSNSISYLLIHFNKSSSGYECVMKEGFIFL